MNRRSAIKAAIGAVADNPVVGQRIGTLTLTGISVSGYGCRVAATCDCGRSISVSWTKLRHYKSCGCRRYELIGQASRKHGHTANYKFSPEYIAWGSMLKRCNNPKAKRYERYGGRGIAVCERWTSFALFFEDMGCKPSPKHQLDRIDNDGNYEPGNVRWATPREQARNTSRNHLLTLNGTTQSIIEWSEATGIKQTTIRQRLKYGWTVERALTDCVRSY